MTPDIVNTVRKCYFLLVLFLTPSELINRKSLIEYCNNEVAEDAHRYQLSRKFVNPASSYPFPLY